MDIQTTRRLLADDIEEHETKVIEAQRRLAYAQANRTPLAEAVARLALDCAAADLAHCIRALQESF